MLDELIGAPRLVEVDGVDVAVGPEVAWERVRHGDLGSSPLVRALFAVRTLPDRLAGRETDGPRLRIDDIAANEQPGFRILAEEPGREIALGAIGEVWKASIPFVDVSSAARFASFAEPGYARVAWALRVSPRGERDARVEVEVRVDATDDASWRRFRRYFRLVGPGSRFIRRTLLAALAHELGTPDAEEHARPLPGDELLPDAVASMTHGRTIRARPDAIWPWLVQMGGRRAGFYSYDVLDNGGRPSAKEIHPELQELAVGQIIPATPEGDEGFEVLQLDPPRALVLGHLHDAAAKRQLAFAAPRPPRYWQTTWAFVLEPLDAETTRLHVRARASFAGRRLRASWIRPVHHFMQSEQLENLAARVEGRVPRDGWRDVLESLAGAAGAALALLTPFLHRARSRWGLDTDTAERSYPGDELVPMPRWSWTHGVEIDAPTEAVWPWVAQIGAERGGFYSYQWLENLAGCNLRNAETVHPEWEIHEGDAITLHPDMPGLPVVAMERGRWFVAHGAPDEVSRARGEPWAAVSWLFFVEALDGGRSRLVSHFRSACSDDLASRLAYGPTFVEPIGFVMDRRMLLGVKERVERRRREALASATP